MKVFRLHEFSELQDEIWDPVPSVQKRLSQDTLGILNTYVQARYVSVALPGCIVPQSTIRELGVGATSWDEPLRRKRQVFIVNLGRRVEDMINDVHNALFLSAVFSVKEDTL